MSKDICTECGADAFIRYSNWVTGDKVVVAANENLCTKCFDKRIVEDKNDKS